MESNHLCLSAETLQVPAFPFCQISMWGSWKIRTFYSSLQGKCYAHLANEPYEQNTKFGFVLSVWKTDVLSTNTNFAYKDMLKYKRSVRESNSFYTRDRGVSCHPTHRAWSEYCELNTIQMAPNHPCYRNTLLWQSRSDSNWESGVWSPAVYH